MEHVPGGGGCLTVEGTPETKGSAVSMDPKSGEGLGMEKDWIVSVGETIFKVFPLRPLRRPWQRRWKRFSGQRPQIKKRMNEERGLGVQVSVRA